MLVLQTVPTYSSKKITKLLRLTEKLNSVLFHFFLNLQISDLQKAEITYKTARIRTNNK